MERATQVRVDPSNICAPHLHGNSDRKITIVALCILFPFRNYFRSLIPVAFILRRVNAVPIVSKRDIFQIYRKALRRVIKTSGLDGRVVAFPVELRFYRYYVLTSGHNSLRGAIARLHVRVQARVPLEIR